MYCTHCGNKLPESSKFCSACGKAATQRDVKTNNTDITYRVADENPYASAITHTPVKEENISSQSYTQATQPAQNPCPTPQAQYFPNTSPQYLRPVQTPQGVQYVPIEPITYYQKPAPKHNPFTFVSAGITGTMILLLFLPWITVGNGGYNIISMLTESTFLERFDAGTFAVCSLFMLICLGMLIPAFILTFVRKNQMPVGFSVTASVLTFVNLFFFLIFTDIATSAVSATIIPVLMFFLAAANIVFAILARKK